jgi:hypothetical protein
VHTCELLLAFIMLFLCFKLGNKLGKFTLKINRKRHTQIALHYFFSKKSASIKMLCHFWHSLYCIRIRMGTILSGEDLKDSGEKGCAEGVRGSRVGRAVRKDSSSKEFKEAAE